MKKEIKEKIEESTFLGYIDGYFQPIKKISNIKYHIIDCNVESIIYDNYDLYDGFIEIEDKLLLQESISFLDENPEILLVIQLSDKNYGSYFREILVDDFKTDLSVSYFNPILPEYYDKEEDFLYADEFNKKPNLDTLVFQKFLDHYGYNDCNHNHRDFFAKGIYLGNEIMIDNSVSLLSFLIKDKSKNKKEKEHWTELINYISIGENIIGGHKSKSDDSLEEMYKEMFSNDNSFFKKSDIHNMFSSLEKIGIIDKNECYFLNSCFYSGRIELNNVDYPIKVVSKEEVSRIASLALRDLKNYSTKRL